MVDLKHNEQESFEGPEILTAHIKAVAKDRTLNPLDESPEMIQKRSKVVRFHPLVKVQLVPTKQEYQKISYLLWFSKTDYSHFIQQARSEVRLFSILKSLELREARRKLYQPCVNEICNANALCLTNISDCSAWKQCATVTASIDCSLCSFLSHGPAARTMDNVWPATLPQPTMKKNGQDGFARREEGDDTEGSGCDEEDEVDSDLTCLSFSAQKERVEVISALRTGYGSQQMKGSGNGLFEGVRTLQRVSWRYYNHWMRVSRRSLGGSVLSVMGVVSVALPIAGFFFMQSLAITGSHG